MPLNVNTDVKPATPDRAILNPTPPSASPRVTSGPENPPAGLIEPELRRSEERLRQGVRVARLGLFEHDHRTDEIYYSRVLREIWGWTPTEPVTLEKIVQSILPEDRAAFAAAVERAHDPKGNGLFISEHRIVWPDGTVRWLSARSQTTFEGEGAQRRPVRTIGALVDITERKQADAALRDHSERLALLSTAASELLTTEDPAPLLKGIFTRLSDLLGLEIYVHYSLAPGGTHLDLAVSSGLTPDVVQQIQRRRLGEAICGSTAASGQRVIVENVQQTTDERTQLIRSLGLTAYACHPLMAQGRLLGTLSFGTRRTATFDPGALDLIQTVCNQAATALARKQAEDALRDSEERWRFALEATELGAWELDLVNHQAWRSVRHDQIFGYRELLPEWTYEMFLEHVLPTDRAEVDRRFRESAANGRNWNFECRIRRTDGATRWIWAQGRSTPDAQGRPMRMFGLVWDITAQKEAEAVLRYAHDRLEQRVAERTAELARANEQLVSEVAERSRAEQALLRQAALLNMTSDAIVIRGFDGGDIRYWNRGAERLYGYSSSEAKDRNPRDLLAPVFPQGEAAFTAALLKDGSWTGELTHTTKTGRKVIVESHHQLVHHPDGTRLVLETNHDITERVELHEEIVGAGERERERIGQNLHDGLCQLLTAARFKTDSLLTRLEEDSPCRTSLKSIAAVLAQAVDEARFLARGLEPVEPLPEGLMAALQQLAGVTSRLFNVQCTAEFPRPVLVPDHKAATELFRIAQEAINNALKHGRATVVRVRLDAEPAATLLTVTSNGDPFPAQPRPTGMGLKTMRYRSGRIGAALDIRRGTEGGTVVRCSLPASVPSRSAKGGSP